MPTIILTDLSSNGTRIQGDIVGRNKRRELLDSDMIEFNEGSMYYFNFYNRLSVPGFQGTFKLGTLLSSGPSSKVHRAVDKDTGTEFAVKVFKRQCPKDLLGESAILMSVAHPNIVCLNGTYEDMDGRYLVFELAYEGDLFDYIIKRKKLSEEETRKISKQLLGALEYLVGDRICHGFRPMVTDT